MTSEQFEEFLLKHPEVSWVPARLTSGHVEGVDLEQADGLAFKVEGVPWYENEKNVTFVHAGATARLSPDQLMTELTRGMNLDHITRITGYFTRVSSWNKGKRAELTDRYRNPGMQMERV